jgi:hypothetical protein
VNASLLALHRHTEAEPVLLAAAKGLETKRGANFYRTQDAYSDLRDLYVARGDSAHASQWAAKLRPQ